MKKPNFVAAALVMFGVVSVSMLLPTATEAAKRKPRVCEVKQLEKRPYGLPIYVGNMPDGEFTGNEEFLKGFACVPKDGKAGKCSFVARDGRLKCLEVN